jgi:hypothetical protein
MVDRGRTVLSGQRQIHGVSLPLIGGTAWRPSFGRLQLAAKRRHQVLLYVLKVSTGDICMYSDATLIAA